MNEKFTAVGEVPTSNRVFVSKGWGYEDWIWNGSLYCGKVLFIKQDKACSWHYHKIKDEVFYIQDGRIIVSYGWNDDHMKADRVTLSRGNVFHVPTGMRHQMLAVEDAHIFEFSTHHEDSDSIRLIKGD
jgi:mannose-6-phosphate isomerase-like protein (cupin superfamily)